MSERKAHFEKKENEASQALIALIRPQTNIRHAFACVGPTW